MPADVQGVYGLDETRLAQALGRLLQSKKALIRVVQGPGLRRLEDPAGFSALKQVLVGPHDGISLFFSPLQDFSIVHACINHHAQIHKRLIFFPFFNGALVFFKILV